MTTVRKFTIAAGAIAASALVLGCATGKHRTPEETAAKLRSVLNRLDPDGEARAKLCEELQAAPTDGAQQ